MKHLLDGAGCGPSLDQKQIVDGVNLSAGGFLVCARVVGLEAVIHVHDPNGAISGRLAFTQVVGVKDIHHLRRDVLPADLADRDHGISAPSIVSIAASSDCLRQ